MGLRIGTIALFFLFFAGNTIHPARAQYAQDRDSVVLNWSELDLTGAYFKQHTTFRMPAWPFIALGAAGLGVGGYYLFQGSGPKPLIEAVDDRVSATCLASLAFNVLNNDQGDGLVVVQVLGVPSGITVEIGSGGLLQIDNVGSASFTFSYRVEDVHGQRRDAQVSVEVLLSALIVRDDEAEVPAGDSVQFNVLANDDGVSLRVVGHSTPTAGTVSVAEDGTAVFFSPAGTEACGEAEFTYTVEDGCGQRAEGRVLVRTLDTKPPEITCPPRYDLSCGQTPDPEITGRPVVSDDCDADPEVRYEDSPGTGNCPVTSTIIRRWTVTDASGNETSCQQTIRFLDGEPPAITCPPNISLPCGSSLLPAVTGSASATDDCTAPEDIVLTYADNTAGLNQCGGTGVIVRTWTARDKCNRTATCTQRITLTDVTPPVIVCPADITIGCDVGIDPDVTGWATATDACSGAGDVELTYIDQITGSINCQGTGQVRRTWVATDACGNTSTCIQNIQVNPIAGPSITCPGDRTIDCDDSLNPSNTGRPTGSTSCSVPGELVFTYSDNTVGLVGCNGTGILVRTWRVTDPCNLSKTCTQLITLRDREAPDIDCPRDRNISCRESTDPDNTGWATATDNCGSAEDIQITYSDVVIGRLDCTANGTIRRTWRATDACGNTSTCEQRINVRRDDNSIEPGGPEGYEHVADQTEERPNYYLGFGAFEWVNTAGVAWRIEAGTPVPGFMGIPAQGMQWGIGMVRYLSAGSWSPYLGVGFGTLPVPHQAGERPAENPGAERYAVDVAAHLNLGVRYVTHRRWAVNMEFRIAGAVDGYNIHTRARTPVQFRTFFFRRF
jgi:hypothetical protein